MDNNLYLRSENVLPLHTKSDVRTNFETSSITEVPALLPAGKRNLCIATPDIIGPVRNGGIGTACEAIARTWADAGHRVTILYITDQFPSDVNLERWHAHYLSSNIDFVLCPHSQHRLTNPAPLQLSYNAWMWLKGRHFDLIYFPEWKGCGHYSLAAKTCGLAFRNTRILVGAHSPTLWHLEGNQQLPSDVESLCADALERQSVAAADAVISPSIYMLQWMDQAGWKLPKTYHVIPNPLPLHGYGKSIRAFDKTVKEIVFFGRLEARKGLQVFISALKRIDGKLLQSVRITFLGKDGGNGAISLIESARQPSVTDWVILQEYDASSATNYVSAPGRLAVMPSLCENASMAVAECIGRGASFLASDTGGTSDMLHPDDRAIHLVQPGAEPLAAALTRILRDGLPPKARPAIPADKVDETWHSLVDAYARPHENKSDGLFRPLVSIVLVTYERPELLIQALDGLRGQTWPKFEVILVDDGSKQPQSISLLDSLESEFSQRGWTIIRQENRYLGAARNAGWRKSCGEYVIFHDDDNVSLPNLVETFARVIDYAKADIVTAAMATFQGKDPPNKNLHNDNEIFAPIGDISSVGMFLNLFGDAHACIRRDALERLDGFSEDVGVGHEDWELFARATMAGMKIVAIPEPLFWYRISTDSMLRTSRNPEMDLIRSGRPFLQLIPPQYRAAMLHGLALSHRSLNRQAWPVKDSFQSSRCYRISMGYYTMFSRPFIGPILTTIRNSLVKSLSWITYTSR